MRGLLSSPLILEHAGRKRLGLMYASPGLINPLCSKHCGYSENTCPGWWGDRAGEVSCCRDSLPCSATLAGRAPPAPGPRPPQQIHCDLIRARKGLSTRRRASLPCRSDTSHQNGREDAGETYRLHSSFPQKKTQVFRHTPMHTRTCTHIYIHTLTLPRMSATWVQVYLLFCL